MVLMMNDQLKQINIAAFPQQLKDTPAWITWQREPNKDRPEEARKVPLLADGSPAAGNYQSQLQGSLDQAMNTVLDGRADGLGFVLNGHHDYICIDLDNDEGIGEIPAELLQLTELGYTEKSISGKGLHVWIRGTIPDGYRKKKTVHIDGSAHTIEIYSSGRFMIMTGDKFNDYGIIDQQEELNKILEKYGFAADQKTPIPEPTPTPAGGITELEISKVLQRMKSSKNGREIMDLFNGVDYDHSRRSEDDKALVNHVTFYAAHNTALSKAVLLRSARRRGKWFDQRGDHTWLDLEIYESCKGDCYPIREFAKSKNELIDQLQEVGNQWREAAEEHNKPPKMDHAEIAWILKKHCRIFNIYEEDPSFTRLGVYDPDTGLYDFSEKTIGAYVIAINPRANEQQRKEVRKYLEIEAPKKTTPDCAADLVLVGNGIFDRRDKKLSPFDPEIYLPNRVTTNYVPGAKEPEFAAGDRTWKFSTWLQEITDTPEQLDYFWRIIANGITGNAVSGKAVWFYDRDGDTGKSTFGKLLKYVVGSENTSSLSIKEHEDKSRLETMYGNTLNIGHENRASDFLKNTENYKKGRTGDDLLLEAKFGRPYKAILKNFDIQMMNELPKVKELNNSFWRRIVIIAFKMFKGEKIPEVETQFIKDRRLHEFILATALQLDEITLYDTPESEALKNQAVIEGDPVADFLNELLPELESTQINSTFLFLAYQEKHWNEYGKLPDMKKNGFTRKVAELSKRFNIRQERGKMKRAALIGTDYKRTLEVIGADKGTPKLEAALMYTNATSYFERI